MKRFTLIFCLLLCNPISYADIHLVFGLYSSDKPSAMVNTFRPLLNQIQQDLAQQLQQPVNIRIHIAASYDAGIDDLVQGRVDFARFGPASYVLAKQQNPAIQILAMETESGQKRFNGIICVHQDSPVQTLEQLKGKRFAFGDAHSTIGRYLSQNLLLQHGINAQQLSDYAYLERHDRVGTSVALGLYDAGALKENTFNKLIQRGEPLRVLARFDNVTKPWLASANMPQDLQAALRQVLYQLHQHAQLNQDVDPLVSGSDQDYDFIRQAMQHSQAFAQEP